MCIVWQNIIHPQILHNFIDIYLVGYGDLDAPMPLYLCAIP